MNAPENRSGNHETESSFDVVVVGAGQAGLAMGYFLKRQGRQFLIAEATSVASAWRERWDSLTLFTPRRYSGLPGLPFPGAPDGYPTRDEVVAYLEAYAERFELPVEEHAPVRSLTAEDGRFVLDVDGKAITADQVVVATGPFQTPYVPDVAEGSPRTSSRPMRPVIASRPTSPGGQCSWWAVATRVFRSQRSSRRRMRSSSRWARARHRYRSASSAAISSGG